MAKFLEEQAILRYKAEHWGMFQQARAAVIVLVEKPKSESSRTFAQALKPSQKRRQAACSIIRIQLDLLKTLNYNDRAGFMLFIQLTASAKDLPPLFFTKKNLKFCIQNAKFCKLKRQILQKFCNVFTQPNFFICNANTAVTHPQSPLFF